MIIIILADFSMRGYPQPNFVEDKLFSLGLNSSLQSKSWPKAEHKVPFNTTTTTTKQEAKIWYVDFTKDRDFEYRGNWPMLTIKLQAKGFQLTLLPHKLKADPFPSQDQSQAEPFRPKSCSFKDPSFGCGDIYKTILTFV